MKKLIILFILTISFGCAAPKSSKSYAYEHHTYIKNKNEQLLSDELLNLKPEELPQYFPANEQFNCECTFTPAEKRQAIDIKTSIGASRQYKVFGKASCIIGKKAIDLTIYVPIRRIPGTLKHLFLPVKDKTCGKSTYGGGRYAELYESDVDGNKIFIDFNKLYNPYCAYRPDFACPATPKENHIDIAIKAGQKYR